MEKAGCQGEESKEKKHGPRYTGPEVPSGRRNSLTAVGMPRGIEKEARSKKNACPEKRCSIQSNDSSKAKKRFCRKPTGARLLFVAWTRVRWAGRKVKSSQTLGRELKNDLPAAKRKIERATQCARGAGGSGEEKRFGSDSGVFGKKNKQMKA